MKTILTGIAIMMALALVAQQPLLSGKITYERKLSVIRSMDEENKGDDNIWYTEMRKKLPKYKTDIYRLSFNTRQSLYTTVQEDEHPMLRWHKTVSDLVQRTDFVKDSTWANRTVFDKKYLVTDSIMKPVWKFSGEYREIAGYNCRKATTIVYDSVYIIAFFTEAIPVSGGPDMYAGLPGMILGVVIPRLHTTLFATRVEITLPAEADFVFQPVRKAMRVNREGYRLDLYSDTERWGNYGSRFVLKALF